MPRSSLKLNAGSKALKDYYATLHEGVQLAIDHELGIRHAFETLLDHCARRSGWTLAREYSVRRGARTLRPDGTVLDQFRLSRGWYEAKGADADLAKEARDKLTKGYPRQNTLFWQPGRVLLYQGTDVFDFDITNPAALARALVRFFEHEEPEVERWEEAVVRFKDRVPELAESLLTLIRREKRSNARFRTGFGGFFDACRASINPNLSVAAVEEMLVQHLLTERIFSKVFDNPDFARRNAIAAEIETVIDALTSQSFSRHDFLRSLDPFYGAIESTAATIRDFDQKQGFLNTVYEQFFQGFSVKLADTHGIVYTPQSIVDFMVRSVDELLASEFGASLAATGVHVLDPFVGTGNFIIRVLRQIAATRKSALPAKYARELHANEVMLLPYYIASMNIEHAYFELVGRYDPFDGICLVDTFELAEPRQRPLFTEANTERVQRQKHAPIRVVIGNPPYNVGQVNENDNNKNRRYPAIDQRVRETYAQDSNASSTSKLNDPYIKAIRWATDRIGDEGIVAFVCNRKFVDGIATDGVRKRLAEEFDSIYLLDLGGDVRKNPKLSGTTHNVFGIQPGVSINFFVRRRERRPRARILYFRTEESWRKEQKYRFLEERQHVANVAWQPVEPNSRHIWLTQGLRREFPTLMPLGDKLSTPGVAESVFGFYILGVTTVCDAWVYNFNRHALAVNMHRMIDTYNDHVARWPLARAEKKLDDWVEGDGKKIAWSRDLKRDVERHRICTFDEARIRAASYRPFVRNYLYYDPMMNEEPRLFERVFPTPASEDENCVLSVGGYGRKPFSVFVCKEISDLNFYADPHQCFPFYIYDAAGSKRRENVTDWALDVFQKHYRDRTISKWDIFHYVYAMLHLPAYRERYTADLERALPRVPFTPEFRTFAAAGARLADLHLHYDRQQEFPLTERWKAGARLDLRVERMKYDTASGEITYNRALTLSGVPRAVERYCLGRRSALAWVIEHYRVTTDGRSGIVNDPNLEDAPGRILRLLGQVIAVSLETVRLVDALPKPSFGPAEGGA